MQLARPGPAASHPLEAIVLPDPRPGPGEILLAVTACAVCRTDLQICEGDLVAKRLPIIPGHQIVGRVEALGPGVESFRVGDRAGAAWLGGTDGSVDVSQIIAGIDWAKNNATVGPIADSNTAGMLRPSHSRGRV